MSSIREQIVDAVKVALEEISVANGYDNDIPGGVQRFQQSGAELSSPPAILVVIDSEQKQLVESNMYSCTLTVDIDVLAIDHEDISAETATYIDTLTTDVERALAVELDLGALATDWGVSSITPQSLVEGQPYVGFTVSLSVQYRHDATDPRIAR